MALLLVLSNMPACCKGESECASICHKITCEVFVSSFAFIMGNKLSSNLKDIDIFICLLMGMGLLALVPLVACLEIPVIFSTASKVSTLNTDDDEVQFVKTKKQNQRQRLN